MGEDTARVAGVVSSDVGTRKLQWSWSENTRKLALDGVTDPSLKSWFSTIRAVVFCPEDIAIVRAEPGLRRRFIDRAAFTLRPGHLSLVQDYSKILRHKVALLKSRASESQRSTFDTELARVGARLMVRRCEAISALIDPLNEIHSCIAGQGTVRLKLRSAGGVDSDQSEEDLRRALEESISAKSQEELMRGQALVGPHRDELEIYIDDKLARSYASQGQARSVVLALKLAQWSAAGAGGEPPLFLLDDLGSELDGHRRARLLELLGDLPGQVWVTTTDPGFVDAVPADERQLHRVDSGRITPD